jgi:hypothetical protein
VPSVKIIETASTDFPGAVELPNHGGRPQSKHQKSPGGNSGSGKTKTSYLPRLSGKALTDQQKADQAQTAANQMVMALINGKRKFMRRSDYERLRADGNLG